MNVVTLATALACLISAPAQRAAPKRSLVINCTPKTVQIDRAPAKTVKNPIADALRQAGPGSVIKLQPGTYPSFGIGFGHDKAWNARTSGGTPSQPILIYAPVGATIAPSSPGQGDTIAINADTKPGHITFQNITIVPGYRAGVIFYQGKFGVSYEGFRFLDCDIKGTWDHAKDSGGKSTWGLWGRGLKDFEFRGVQRRVQVSDLRKEHGFYIQNPQGNILIENVDGKRLGRTFCQFTARTSDGPPSTATITIRNCHIEDCGIAKTDDYKGGTALTFSGRLTGNIVVEGCTVRAGFDPAIRKLTRKDAPHGTSALVCWDYRGTPNGSVTLKDNDFEFFPGCGDRPLVSLGGCREIQIIGRNRFKSGGKQAALVFDPLDQKNRNRTQNTPNGRVYLDPATSIDGGIQVRGHMATDKERAELHTPFSPGGH